MKRKGKARTGRRVPMGPKPAASPPRASVATRTAYAGRDDEEAMLARLESFQATASPARHGVLADRPASVSGGGAAGLKGGD